MAWPVLGTVGGCCGGVLRAVGPAVERGFCGCPACWVAHLLRAGRGLFPGTVGAAGVRVCGA